MTVAVLQVGKGLSFCCSETEWSLSFFIAIDGLLIFSVGAKSGPLKQNWLIYVLSIGER